MSEPDTLDPASGADVEAARRRLAAAQHALLSSLVDGAPVPSGFDRERWEVQRRALLAKRTSVVATVAPELPEILGPERFRKAFRRYADGRAMTGGYRLDAMRFAAWMLEHGQPKENARARRRLRRWWKDRARPTPPRRPVRRALRWMRDALTTSEG